MPDLMQQFVRLTRAMPSKRPTEIRKDDFGEIYAAFDSTQATEQASRCEQCGIPFCQIHCPLGNNIPDWLRMATEGRMEEAYAISQATNTFPEICGRICPQDRLCEGLCVLQQSGHETVTIGSIEKHITETAFDNGWVKPPKPMQERTGRVAVIGAGPAGLAAAERLRTRGWQVHVYDRHDRAGGLLIYGIPNFKLDKDIVARRIRLLEEGGIHFHYNTDIGRDISFARLRTDHDAVLVATGVYQARELKVPGAGLKGVVKALDFLIAANKTGLGDKVPDFENGTYNANDKHVVVIGGGDTAMDCVRTSIRQGAKSVKCLYRRDRDNMPGSAREVAHAEEEGAEFIWLAAPEAFHGSNQVEKVMATKMRLGEAGADGRRTVEAVRDSSFALQAHMVISALGFEPEDLPALFDTPALPLHDDGTVALMPNTPASPPPEATVDTPMDAVDASVDASVRGSGMTPLEDVYAAGDIVRGASLVVWAILDGRNAADDIHRALLNKVRQQPHEQSPNNT